MLGRPRVVDEESLLAKDGIVMMLFHSHVPDNLPKSVMLFANLKGFKIEVSVEFPKPLPPLMLGQRTKEMMIRKMTRMANNRPETKANLTAIGRGICLRTRRKPRIREPPLPPRPRLVWC
jgi:hypothetical protein